MNEILSLLEKNMGAKKFLFCLFSHHKINQAGRGNWGLRVVIRPHFWVGTAQFLSQDHHGSYRATWEHQLPNYFEKKMSIMVVIKILNSYFEWQHLNSTILQCFIGETLDLIALLVPNDSLALLCIFPCDHNEHNYSAFSCIYVLKHEFNVF